MAPWQHRHPLLDARDDLLASVPAGGPRSEPRPWCLLAAYQGYMSSIFFGDTMVPNIE